MISAISVLPMLGHIRICDHHRLKELRGSRGIKKSAGPLFHGDIALSGGYFRIVITCGRVKGIKRFIAQGA